MMNNKLYYILFFNLGTSIGLLSYDILSNVFLIGDKGVKYYGEAHLSLLNKWIHTICMPFTVYGILYWFIGLITTNKKYTNQLTWFLYLLFGGHYLRISFMGALRYYILYYPVAKIFIKHNNQDLYNKYTKKNLIKKGFIISILSLTIQEYVGHTLGGDIQSRPEGVLNAILYACYFSANH